MAITLYLECWRKSVDSSEGRIRLHPEVEEFRKTLQPEEAEAFNECLIRLLRNPRADKKRKFIVRLRPPLVDFMYRDQNFVLYYRWFQLERTDTDWTYRVEIFEAIRTRDIE